MDSTADVPFLTAVAWLAVHELDAMGRSEWRFFSARVPASDETAYRVFAAVHVPAFVLVLWFLDSPSFRLGVDAFLLVHAGLHLALRDHPQLDFDDWFSGVWIYGGALLGALHLFLSL